MHRPTLLSSSGPRDPERYLLLYESPTRHLVIGLPLCMLLDWVRLHNDNQRLSVEILKNDAELALTFTNSALLRSDRKSAAQSVRHARRAYDFIAGKRTEVAISDADAKELDWKLAILRKQLEDLGEKF